MLILLSVSGTDEKSPSSFNDVTPSISGLNSFFGDILICPIMGKAVGESSVFFVGVITTGGGPVTGG